MSGRQERLVWVDIAKGIGIILVVFGHTALGLINAGLTPKNGPLYASIEWTYAFHMPLFFFLSGLFARRRLDASFRDFVGSNLRGIAYPYVIWASFQICIQSLLSGSTNEPASFSDLLWIFHRPSRQYWFLYVLFFCNAAHWGLARIFSSHAAALAASVVLHCLAPLALPTTWSPLLLTFYYLPLMAGAALLASDLELFEKVPSGWAVLAGALFLGAIVFAIPPFAPRRFLPVQSLFGTLGAILLSVGFARLKGNDFLRVLGQASLEIYVAHTLATAGVRIVLMRLGVQTLGVHLVLGALAGIVFPLLVVRVARTFGIPYLFTLKQREKLG